MTIGYRIENDLVIVIPRGINTLGAVCRIFDVILADPAFNFPAKILFDARHTDYGPPGEELEALSEYLAGIEAFRDSRWAIVANSNTLIYGLTRMFCCLAESQGICVEPFSDVEAARQWLITSNKDYQNGNGLSNRAFLPDRISF